MKAKLMALVLAAGLGVTGIAVTVHAAENACIEHSWENVGDSYEYYEEWSNFNHAKHTVQDKWCSVCKIWGRDDESVFEDHTLVLQPYANVWECIYCGYTE